MKSGLQGNDGDNRRGNESVLDELQWKLQKAENEE